VLGNIYSDRSLDAFRDITTDGQHKTDPYTEWFGTKTHILLQNNCCVIRPLFNGELYTVTIDYCNTVKAQQRQQFALFMLIDIILLAVTIVMITNLIFSYRRQIIRLATIDELTGLMNRKSFHTEYAEFITEKRDEPFVLFLLDIDYFKQINDGYGHAAGDQALVYLADTIRSMIDEKGGFSGRWGGDEFIGVLRLNGESAAEALSRLCRNIEASPRPEGYKMTISVGAVEADRAAEGETVLSKLSEKADLALYESKENGRNRTTLYHPDLEEVSAVASLVNVSAAVSSDIKSSDTASSVSEASPISAAAPVSTSSPVSAAATTDISSDSPADKQVQTSADASDVLSGNTAKIQGNSLLERLKFLLRRKLIESTVFGVRWMAPFVAGGGILIALAFLFDAASIDLSTLPISERSNFGTLTPLAATLKTIGVSTFNFMLPVFAGFMAYSLAGEDAFLAGFAGGFMAYDQACI
jgi:diguanylate cyclase (GGDEF)-like protein